MHSAITLLRAVIVCLKGVARCYSLLFSVIKSRALFFALLVFLTTFVAVMGIVELFLIGVGLSMDAFAVAIGKGLSVSKVSPRQALVTGVWFGLFQALMPLIGFLLGVSFSDAVESVDHWIAFVLLGAIGFNMIHDSFSRDEDKSDNNFSARAMLPLAVATSIDALAVGVSFAFIKVDILPAVSVIGLVTLTLSFAGVYIGSIFGNRYKSKAEFMGGALLILMGIKILIEHTM